MTTPTTGRRERKKAATRQALADAALRLFLERGYDQVGIREIAEAADMSTTTLFKHFPSKEALVFDEDQDREAALVAAVRDRPPGTSVVQALHTYVSGGRAMDSSDLVTFQALIESTPALRAYADRMWTRHTEALAAAIADAYEVPHDDLACATLARFVLETPSLIRGRPDPHAALDQVFAILTHGWRPPGDGEAEVSGPRPGSGAAGGGRSGRPG
ncbi:helix-turn-helix domain-containing protein [Actinoplanes sp. NPDC051851]|uniref:TetR/AcrR family transcriptional regulator n=1 Tax=Actinoplanes sp. NPDC051851 TaxID=3154753 RepID=UPI00342DB52E